MWCQWKYWAHWVKQEHRVLKISMWMIYYKQNIIYSFIISSHIQPIPPWHFQLLHCVLRWYRSDDNFVLQENHSATQCLSRIGLLKKGIPCVSVCLTIISAGAFYYSHTLCSGLVFSMVIHAGLPCEEQNTHDRRWQDIQDLLLCLMTTYKWFFNMKCLCNFAELVQFQSLFPM